MCVRIATDSVLTVLSLQLRVHLDTFGPFTSLVH